MDLPKLKLTLGYDGTEFHGFQRQSGLRTVQGELEQWLSRAAGNPVVVTGASRTDAGVHARSQVVHFAANEIPIPAKNLMAYARGTLPQDLVLRKVELKRQEFHARFGTRFKTYRYMLDIGSVPDVFLRRYAFHVPHELHLGLMQQAAGALVGRHDFTSFCTARATQENNIREIYQIDIRRSNQDLVIIDVTGNGFLYNMVRILVGTLVAVGKKSISADKMAEILLAKDRREAGPTAPPHGLTLWHIEYEKEWFLTEQQISSYY